MTDKNHELDDDNDNDFIDGGHIVDTGSAFEPTFPEPKEGGEPKEKVEIEVIDDTPPEDRGRRPASHAALDPTEEEMEQYSAKVQNRLRELTRARHDERRRAEAALRERDELKRAATAFSTRTQEMENYIAMGQTAYIENAKKLATVSIESAKQKLRTAMDAGDSDGIVTAQQLLTEAQIQLDQANNFRAPPLQKPKEDGYTEPTVSKRTVEQPKLDDRTTDWLVANPWFQRQGDEDLTGYAMGLHNKLIHERGPAFAQDPSYFKTIDSAMRKAFPDRFEASEHEPESRNQAPANRRPSTVVAPAQRNGTTKKIRLTQTQVNIARELGISLEGYARQLAALEKK